MLPGSPRTLGRHNEHFARFENEMSPSVHVAGIVVCATMAAALGSVLVGWFGANVLDTCDPKFGCSFGLQFGSIVAGVIGALVSVVLICFASAYSAFSNKALAAKTALLVAAAAGFTIGAALAIAALATHG